MIDISLTAFCYSSLLKNIYWLETRNIFSLKMKVKMSEMFYTRIVQIDIWILRIDIILWMNHLELILKNNIKGFTVVQLLGNSV